MALSLTRTIFSPSDQYRRNDPVMDSQSLCHAAGLLQRSARAEHKKLSRLKSNRPSKGQASLGKSLGTSLFKSLLAKLTLLKPVFVDFQGSNFRFQSRGRNAELGCRTR